MWLIIAFSVFLRVSEAEMVPSCSSRVFCQGQLLHLVQSRQILKEINFVRMKLRRPESEILERFQIFIQTHPEPTNQHLKNFVYDNFELPEKELELWTPNDFIPNPKFLDKIKDENFKQFGIDVNNIWPQLGRKVSQSVKDFNHLFTLAPLPNGFIIPGGMFEELYYWDSYWIIKGLIVSNMTETAKGMLENLLALVKMYGFVPNGSRSFFSSRSQPPLLTAMVSLYVEATNDLNWLADKMSLLEEEIGFWMNKRTVNIEKNGKLYTLLRYFSDTEGPRPESYIFDWTHSLSLKSEREKQRFFTNIKSAAESGWDFSSRWLISENSTNIGSSLTDINTEMIIPVDLNAFFASALQTIADFWLKLGKKNKALSSLNSAKKWRQTIHEVFWHERDGIWYDYDFVNKKHRSNFYVSNFSPLWAGIVSKSEMENVAPKVLQYLKLNRTLEFAGGIPTSLIASGHQWDFPNVWPPLQSMMIGALRAMKLPEANEIARSQAEKWVTSNLKGFRESGQMFEKYDALNPGKSGGGGEYTAQTGFGWTNGVLLELLNDYGDRIKFLL